MSTLYYAGIGSRETPKKIQYLMRDIAFALAELKWVLNSGGANGADLAFQIGCEDYCKKNNILYADRQQIFLPWNGFNDLKVRVGNGYIVYPKSTKAIDLIKELHPIPSSILVKESLTALMSRNANQVLGIDLKTPIKMIICYSDKDIKFDETGDRKSVV